jgi:hypothetical protein
MGQPKRVGGVRLVPLRRHLSANRSSPI